MARLSGKDLYLTFGSTVLDTDYQSFDPSEEGKQVEITAGDDANATYTATYKDGKASYKGLYDSSSGSTIWAAVAPNTSGTLTWGPRGTATGYQKHVVPAIVSSRAASYPFDGKIEISIEFQYNGAVTDTTF